MKNLIVTTYIVYLPVALLLTLLVAKVFFKNSKIFMMDIFRGRQDIANSTNKLFEIGFYLLSLGFALFIMKVDGYRTIDLQDFYEILTEKVGVLSVFLGGMVFFNLYMLFRGKKKTAENNLLRKRIENQRANTEVTVKPKF
ncbi:MAG: hypothetical protein JJ975_16275 [Bacteroidia bacterium]|nr:hypothetical protein [Bacteroidia bacterium]